MIVHHDKHHMKVSVAITSYNHERYIESCVLSALLQDTDFEYEVIVGDDCSDDGTRTKLKNLQQIFPDTLSLILPTKKRGANLLFNDIMHECRGQYVAWLDGDDYWTSAYKLRKQSRFLDDHLNLAVCFHNVTRFYEDGSAPATQENILCGKDVSRLHDLIISNYIPSPSVMYRKELWPKFDDDYSEVIFGDWVALCFMAQHGDIGFIDENMAAYRVHAGGMWSGKSIDEQIVLTIQAYEYMRNRIESIYVNQIDEWKSKTLARLAVEQAHVPRGSIVLVMGEGEDPHLFLDGRQVEHFPHDQDGKDTDIHDMDISTVRTQLEELRRLGRRYLLIPSSSSWWRGNYHYFHQHLEASHNCIRWDADWSIYELCSQGQIQAIDVTFNASDDRLLGFHLDRPRVGDVDVSDALQLVGWALGRNQSVVAVEAVGQERVLGRVPLNARRPDLVAAFPDVDGADHAGFRMTVALAEVETTVQVRAILSDQTRVPLAVIGVRTASDASNPSRSFLQTTPDPDGLSKLPQPTEGFLDAVGQTNVERPQSAPVVVGANESFRVQGWAIDRIAAGTAGGVFVVVDDSLLVYAEYGQERPDVAEYLGETYRHSGFTVEIPAPHFSPGVHSMEMWVLSQDQSAYYAPSEQMRAKFQIS